MIAFGTSVPNLFGVEHMDIHLECQSGLLLDLALEVVVKHLEVNINVLVSDDDGISVPSRTYDPENPPLSMLVL